VMQDVWQHQHQGNGRSSLVNQTYERKIRICSDMNRIQVKT
jgi:hypothetical protein